VLSSSGSVAAYSEGRASPSDSIVWGRGSTWLSGGLALTPQGAVVDVPATSGADVRVLSTITTRVPSRVPLSAWFNKL
jgi:hypothetical protein